MRPLITCDVSESHVAGHAGVTEANMMQYLGIIEQRTNEILQMYAAVQMQQQVLVHPPRTKPISKPQG